MSIIIDFTEACAMLRLYEQVVEDGLLTEEEVITACCDQIQIRPEPDPTI